MANYQDKAAELGKRIVDSVQKDLDAMRRSGDSAEAALAAGKIYELDSNYDAAIACYEQAISLKPDLNEAKARLAVAAAKGGQIDKAVNAAVELAGHAPDATIPSLINRSPLSPFSILGDVLLAAGQHEGAVAAFNQALKSHPNDRYAAQHFGSVSTERSVTTAVSAAVARLSKNHPNLVPAVTEVLRRVSFRNSRMA